MTLIVCLDQKNGISFNNRRQSRDSVVIERVCKIAENSKLYINEYSKSLFPLPCSFVKVSAKPLQSAKSNDVCFLETDLTDIKSDTIDKIIIYRWDKVYPNDKTFCINLSEWKLISTEEFTGTSHDTITEEVYTK